MAEGLLTVQAEHKSGYLAIIDINESWLCNDWFNENAIIY
jgi:hypothetical protein